jgi:selT/selW/selH-like putative selenoprotein
LAAELEEAFPGVEVQLMPSGGGVFEVTADGALVFSKKKLRRHAEAGEIPRLIKERGR